MKVALYARKSKGMPAEVQMRRLRAVADQEGHEIVLAAQDVASGRDPNRPGWDDVVRAVKGGAVRSVWMTKTDRAMRSARHYLAVVEDVLEPRGCQLRVLDQPMASVTDYNDPLAKAFRTIGAVFAQLEVDLADERSNEGHELRDGRWYGPSGEPVGRPPGRKVGGEFVPWGSDHKFRVRNGRRVHDKLRCRACGETGGQPAPLSDPPAEPGAAEPNGCATPEPGA
ncbi:MAG: recombinase family protein [Thermoplasmatota archaeon]